MSQKTGAGFWLWKPAIILDALENCEDGTVLLYTDAGMRMVADPSPMLAHALDFPIMVFEHIFPIPSGPLTYPMHQWTKRDCFILLGADRPEVHNAQQPWAGVQIYRNGPAARAFVRELAMAGTDARILTDMANTQGLDNLPGFKHHRHDQSILGIIAYGHRLPRFPDPTQYGHKGPRPALSADLDGMARPAASYGQIFDLHRRRDRQNILATARRWLSPIRPGQWQECEADLPLEQDHARMELVVTAKN